jgi:hypothetical protein
VSLFPVVSIPTALWSCLLVATATDTVATTEVVAATTTFAAVTALLLLLLSSLCYQLSALY